MTMIRYIYETIDDGILIYNIYLPKIMKGETFTTEKEKRYHQNECVSFFIWVLHHNCKLAEIEIVVKIAVNNQ
jgi:hypothetical protein